MTQYPGVGERLAEELTGAHRARLRRVHCGQWGRAMKTRRATNSGTAQCARRTRTGREFIDPAESRLDHAALDEERGKIGAGKKTRARFTLRLDHPERRRVHELIGLLD